jgi:hypothetical protein
MIRTHLIPNLLPLHQRLPCQLGSPVQKPCIINMLDACQSRNLAVQKHSDIVRSKYPDCSTVVSAELFEVV